MKLKIRYQPVRESNVELSILDKGDWIDLKAAETITLEEGEFKLIPLGIRMKLPEGCEALVVPRSSTFKNFGVIQTNSIGVIDNKYCGPNDEWKFPAYALRATTIKEGDRICQFRIAVSQKATVQQKRDWLLADGIELVKEEWLTGTEESRGGFGSTGI